MARFMVYEIEHGGDEAASLEDLKAAGCKDIKVVARDYENAEAIAVECDYPEGVSSSAKLAERLKFACL